MGAYYSNSTVSVNTLTNQTIYHAGRVHVIVVAWPQVPYVARGLPVATVPISHIWHERSHATTNL